MAKDLSYHRAVLGKYKIQLLLCDVEHRTDRDLVARLKLLRAHLQDSFSLTIETDQAIVLEINRAWSRIQGVQNQKRQLISRIWTTQQTVNIRVDEIIQQALEADTGFDHEQETRMRWIDAIIRKALDAGITTIECARPQDEASPAGVGVFPAGVGGQVCQGAHSQAAQAG